MADETITEALVAKAFEVGRPLHATVQRYDTVQLTVTLKDSGGDIVDLTDCSLTVATIDMSGITLWDTTVMDATGGVFKVIFQPKCLGRVDIRVMVTTSEGAVTTFFIGSVSVAVEDKEVTVHGTITSYTAELESAMASIDASAEKADAVILAAETATANAQTAANAANAAAESADEAAEAAQTAATEANELAATAQAVVDNASSVAEAAQTAATEAVQTVSQLQDDINEAVTTAQEAAESVESAAALIGSAVVDIAAADGVLTVTKADGQSSDIEVGTPVTIASDTEVAAMVEAVFGSTSEGEDETVYESDVATDEEVDEMLDSMFG